jgi:hypothetical protein
VALNTTKLRRLSTVVGLALPAAVVIGVPLWLCRRLDQRLTDPGWDRLTKPVQDLTAAHDRMAMTTDRRLRSLEESTARAEAEVRFMATLLGERHGAGPMQQAQTSRADRAQRSPHTPGRSVVRGTHDGVQGTTKGATA